MRISDSGRAIVAVLRAVVLAGLPVLLLLGFTDHIELGVAAGRLAEQRQDRREILQRLSAQADLTRRYADLLERLLRDRRPLAALVPRLARLARVNRGVLDLYLFDATGRLVALPGVPAQKSYAAQRFVQALRRGDAESGRDKLVVGFGGNDGVIGRLLAAPATLLDLGNGERNSLGGWWPLRDRRGAVVGDVVAFVHRGGITVERLLDVAAREQQRLLGPTRRVGWFDPVEHAGLRPGTWPAELTGVIASLPLGESAFVCRGCEGAVLRRDDGLALVCWDEAAVAPARVSAWFRPVRALVVSLGVVGGLALWLVGSGLWTVRLGVRGRLVALLVASGGLPLIVLLATAVFDRSDRAVVLRERCEREHLDQLARIDDDLDREFLPLIRRYDRLVREVSQRSWSDAAPLFAGIARWAATQPFLDRLVLVDRRGVAHLRLVLGSHQAAARERLGEAVRLLTLESLRKCNSEVVRGGAQTERAAQTMVHLKFDDWLDDLGRIKLSQVGDEALFSYCLPVYGSGSLFRALFFAFHRVLPVQIRYLRRIVGERARRDPGAPRLIALPVVAGGVRPCFPNAAAGRDPALRRLRDLVLATRLPQHGEATLGQRRYLVSAMPGRKLDGYVLMLARPLATLDEAARQLNLRVTALALVLALLAALLAMFASSWLLAPIAGLGRGLADLRAHYYRRHVEPGPVAELAIVAEQLNTVIDDLRDLETAENVQAQLRPERGRREPGWAIDGIRLASPGLTADIYDWFDLGDGRVAVAVGDVAGHGIASALVAAQARIEIVTGLEEGNSPGALLTSVNRRFAARYGRLRPMTLWLGVFTPATGQLVFANAGQPYPLVSGPGTTGMLARPGWPLGASGKTTYDDNTTYIQPGEAVLIYSAGLVEAMAPDGEMFGYPRLALAAQGVCGLPPRRALARVLGEIRRWSRSRVPADDQTAVMLVRADGQQRETGAR